MKNFCDKDFLLSCETAKKLYHNHAERLPIIDYHCHVSPREIAQDRHYSNITEVWLGGDHYKWRAMRSCGIPEKLITGDASDYDKFRAFASCLPSLVGNPMYHWSHLELKRYFGFDGVLDEKTCDAVWTMTAEKLADMGVRKIISMSHVTDICTTDDPCDTLEHHRALQHDKSFSVNVYPAFRPDRALNLRRQDYADYIATLSGASSSSITDFDSLCAALALRINHFDALGCKTADHGMDTAVVFALPKNKKQLDDIFDASLNGGTVTDNDEAIFRTALMRFLAKQYTTRSWVMQIHFGVLRNTNTKMFRMLGADSGYDTVSSYSDINSLAMLLDRLNSDDALPRTIIYPINGGDNEAAAVLIGAFQRDSGGGMPLMMQGSAWWFCDNECGMREQMTTLANLSAFGRFPGMLTDSRSFLSYTRHEYFRRILCDMLGKWVESGRYPNREDYLEKLVDDICYNNTKKFFGF